MTEKQWTKYAKKHLKGRTIIQLRYMTDKEADGIGWVSRPLVLQLDNGSIIFPSQDDEGNDGGTLFGQNRDNEDLLTFPVLRLTK